MKDVDAMKITIYFYKYQYDISLLDVLTTYTISNIYEWRRLLYPFVCTYCVSVCVWLYSPIYFYGVNVRASLEKGNAEVCNLLLLSMHSIELVVATKLDKNTSSVHTHRYKTLASLFYNSFCRSTTISITTTAAKHTAKHEYLFI